MLFSAADAATPLSEVTFVVLDLETTGGSPEGNAITEIGAERYRGGVHLGTFETLVNPGVRIPHDVTYLTGITEAMVAPAPLIESVLPTFLEFIGPAVVVGHNVRFDLAFLGANLRRLGYPPMTNPFVDTCALARRLVRDEVDDCRLGTLARLARTETTPCHRALADAQATAELLHHLLERCGTLGVDCLDDLLALPRTAAHPQVAKLRWVADLPRAGGVFVFRDRAGDVLHVGRSGNIRRRVRSYFASRDRRVVGPLLRDAASVEAIVCDGDLEARVLEIRLLHRHRPRYDAGRRAREQQRFVCRTSAGRLRVTKAPLDSGQVLAGPVASAAAGRLVAGSLGDEGREPSPEVAGILQEHRRLETLVRAGRVEVEADGRRIVIDHGRLTDGALDAVSGPPPGPTWPLSLAAADEVRCVADWLDARTAAGRALQAKGGQASSSATRLWSASAAASTTFGGVPFGSWNDSGPAAAPSSPIVAAPS